MNWSARGYFDVATSHPVRYAARQLIIAVPLAMKLEQGVTVGGDAHDDVLAVAVLDGVDEEVAQDALDAAAVDLGHLAIR